jgi:hypothetical protein
METKCSLFLKDEKIFMKDGNKVLTLNEGWKNQIFLKDGN